MVTFDCPLCERDLVLDDAADETVDCDTCGVRLELATEPAPPVAVAA